MWLCIWYVLSLLCGVYANGVCEQGGWASVVSALPELKVFRRMSMLCDPEISVTTIGENDECATY